MAQSDSEQPEGKGKDPQAGAPPAGLGGPTRADAAPKLGGGNSNVYGATRADAGAGSGGGRSGPHSFAPLDQQYEVVRLIGKGGMGTVSLARDSRLGRYVAVKRLSSEYTSDERLLERFHREAQSIASLMHFHIVHVLTMDEDAEGPYIVMEYVSGPLAGGADWPGDLPNPPLNLEELINRTGMLDAPHTIELGLKLCSAVGFAHKRGVIHRDIKPANIMINEDNEPKLADFGLARQRNSGHDEVTRIGTQLGTMTYSPPEQKEDASRADERADIYTLGGTLWFALTGQHAIYFRESDVPEGLRPILTKALQRDRERRYQTVAELETDLRSASQAGSQAGGPRGLQAPAQPGGIGVCLTCGHQHLIDPNHPLARKFCEACGESLVEPCLKCGTDNGTWSKFCGKCGADLLAALADQTAALQRNRAWIEKLVTAWEYQTAIVTLEKMQAVTHPRLAEFPSWAAGRVGEVRALRAEQQRRSEIVSLLGGVVAHQVSQTVDRAEVLTAAHQYSAAAQLLAAVDADIRDHYWTAAWGKVDGILAELTELRTRAREQFAAKDTRALTPTVRRLLELQPGNEELLKLSDWIARTEARREQAAWDAIVASRSSAGYWKYLEEHPNGAHAGEAHAALAPELRERLLANPKDDQARSQYAEWRTDDLRELDETKAQASLAACFAIFGAIGGGLLGLVVGGPAGVVAGLIGGAIGGGILAGILVGATR
jgi:tRNA A-37 threonylcarbamoyl transferase component Bud32